MNVIIHAVRRARSDALLESPGGSIVGVLYLMHVHELVEHLRGSHTNLHQKKNQCPLPESDTVDSLIPQSTPEQTREKTPIIRNHVNVLLNILTKPSFHHATKSNTNTYHTPVDRNISLRHLRVLVSIHTVPSWW
jgi:hypothetical protein